MKIVGLQELAFKASWLIKLRRRIPSLAKTFAKASQTALGFRTMEIKAFAWPWLSAENWRIFPELCLVKVNAEIRQNATRLEDALEFWSESQKQKLLKLVWLYANLEKIRIQRKFISKVDNGRSFVHLLLFCTGTPWLRCLVAPVRPCQQIVAPPIGTSFKQICYFSCEWFTHDSFSNGCYLFKDCVALSPDCRTCVSGQASCSSRSIQLSCKNHIRIYRKQLLGESVRIITGGGMPYTNAEISPGNYFIGIDLSELLINEVLIPCEPLPEFPVGIRGAVSVSAMVCYWLFLCTSKRNIWCEQKNFF